MSAVDYDLPDFPAHVLMRLCEPNNIKAKPIIIALRCLHDAINANTMELRRMSATPETLRLLLELREKGQQ